ncbi:Acetylornithine deacetylase [Phycisphaerae bacterium RAS1]|nr:Acetylornithine deacetylase [Phycisphaerae bacterium RAS1]
MDGGATRMTDRELLERLVSFDTTSDRPSVAAMDFLAGYLESAGCRVWRQTYESGRKVNLLAGRGSGRWAIANRDLQDAPSVSLCEGLVLSGHIDVVPATEPDWGSNPFQLVERDERFFGRGSADMKGFVALAANRLARTREEEAKRPLRLLVTSDEETGAIGARHFAENWDGHEPLPRSVIIGEPTQLALVRMHKGHMKLRITVTGRAAHSGRPHLGVSAIEHAGVVIAALTALNARMRALRTETSEHFSDCPHPVLNIGTIAGGSAVNIVPERCELNLGVRLLPGQPSELALDLIRESLGKLPEATRERVTLEMLNDNPPMLCDKLATVNIELARMLRQCATGAAPYATDGGWLQKLGLECALLGPGNIEDAHRANESISISQFEAGARRLEEIVRRFCGEEIEPRSHGDTEKTK